jgi:hypothetical protein
LPAYNRVVFVGVFLIRWRVGLRIGLFERAGLDAAGAFRTAQGWVPGCCLLSYFYFLWAPPHNRRSRPRPA